MKFKQKIFFLKNLNFEDKKAVCDFPGPFKSYT